MRRRKIAIIGAGATALIVADMLSVDADVAIYEKGKALGRKFLVAGNGGFNLTNERDGQELIDAYLPKGFMDDCLTDFGSQATRKWLEDLGVSTFVGTSRRVFPLEGTKPIHVLQKIKNKLEKQGCKFYFEHTFCGFDALQKPMVNHKNTTQTIDADNYVFALGGASWPVTGSNRDWLPLFEEIGVKTYPFQSSNCGVNVAWKLDFVEKYAGQPLKNIAITIEGQKQLGEAMITTHGLEGNAIYPLVPWVRGELSKSGDACLFFDFKPQNTVEQLLARIGNKTLLPKQYKYTFKLSKAQLAMVKNSLTKEQYLDAKQFAKAIKRVPVQVQSLRPIEEAISTVGGIDLAAVNSDFSLNAFPHIFVAGEMLNWDAPTGGFLLQGCFSMGAWIAKCIKKNGR